MSTILYFAYGSNMSGGRVSAIACQDADLNLLLGCRTTSFASTSAAMTVL